LSYGPVISSRAADYNSFTNIMSTVLYKKCVYFQNKVSFCFFAGQLGSNRGQMRL